MDNEFSFEITNESKNAINEILKQQGLRHFKLYTDFYGELDVINYEEYQKLEKEKDDLDDCNRHLYNENKKLNNIINELEKEINNQLTMTRRLDKYNEGYFDATLNYYNKLKELKEGK